MTNHVSFYPTIFEKISNWIPSYHTIQTEKVIEIASQNLQTTSNEEKNSLIHQIDDWIVRNGNNRTDQKSLQMFDRQVRPYRSDQGYRHPSNLALQQKWRRARQGEEIFHAFPDFVEFLEKSKLLSQIKITKDELRIIDGEPAMLVEGTWTKAGDLMQRFSISDSEQFHDRFVVDATNSVFTYLDNGLGLQKYHPYLSIGERPISRIDDDGLQKVQTLAQLFRRPNEPANSSLSRPFVLQIVTSYTDRGRSNLSETLRNPRHAYLRVVAGANIPELKVKKGDIWEFGFNIKSSLRPPMVTGQGRFRSPDPWEYTPVDDRYVTNIPISKEETLRVFNYTLGYHRRSIQIGHEIGFHIAQHNCTVFVREAARQAGIELPTEIRLPALIGRIVPTIIKKLTLQICAWISITLNECNLLIQKYTLACVSYRLLDSYHRMMKILQRALAVTAAFLLTPVRALMGDFWGEGGEAFSSKNGKVEPPARKVTNWFKLSSYIFNLPANLQDWQKKQPSTAVFKQPVRLAIY